MDIQPVAILRRQVVPVLVGVSGVFRAMGSLLRMHQNQNVLVEKAACSGWKMVFGVYRFCLLNIRAFMCL